jgi:DNA-binding NarL/FixJ family response regulator
MAHPETNIEELVAGDEFARLEGENLEPGQPYQAFFKEGVADMVLEAIDEADKRNRLRISPYDCIYQIRGDNGTKSISVLFQNQTKDGSLLPPEIQNYVVEGTEARAERLNGAGRAIYGDEDIIPLSSIQAEVFDQIPDRTVIRGSDYFDSELADRGTERLLSSVKQGLLERSPDPEEADDTDRPPEEVFRKYLSPREVEVVALLYRANDDLARALGVAESTVRTHLSNLLHKLELRHSAELAILAAQEGVLDLDTIPLGRTDGLPKRQLELLRNFSDSYEERAKAMQVGVSTVAAHSNSLFKRTGARHRRELALMGFKDGVISPIAWPRPTS